MGTVVKMRAPRLEQTAIHSEPEWLLLTNNLIHSTL